MSKDSKIEEIQSPAVVQNSTQSKEIPILIEQNSSQSSTYSVASVAAVILAGSIAHLFLTWGGFTGQKGWDKLVAVEDWIATFFQS
ncbi:uncharacterized protein C8R40DRAFT_1101093 [Lentinula edodes]|uniref:uncharacterized protein n=1 Tax=Lentinula edodes TaxID=5353 RepID=UPI001E8CA254|nr:uncharacterized protein C8R40DRAFT_1101093 [Lentinula edodes]KAH7876204.1 hypothetical protein C8R40DRAFT_1101093 [Lentinula edodes]